MSSSASSSLIKPRKYDVFLSFRGEDTRNGFISHLYKDLCQKKIETFIDDELPRGDEISPALLTAIEESKISVIIFSRDYAFSKWCLDELEKIMDCKKRNEHYFVVPVFYCIHPSEVRNQRGSFAKAFAMHEEKFKHNIQRVKAWRTVLREAANLSGWDSQVTWPESRLVDEIVTDILKKLNHETSSCFEGLVGIERRMEQVMSLLCVGLPDFRKVGIWGMGGVGKTTLAEAVFNRVSTGFQSSYFLANVRESDEHGRLYQLRQEFLSTILAGGNLHISTPTIAAGFFKDRLRHKKVLVVCDDVTNSRQLEILFGGDVWLGPGSRLIITTRDKQVLRQNDIDLIYEIEELNEDESFQLFCQRAFNRNNLARYQMPLSKMVLNFAKGNPLAIKVIGSSLYGKNERDMESALKKLKQVPNPDIQKLLRISYDALDCEDKEIFLDIACFFTGENIDHVTRIMDACYTSGDLGIKNLIDKSLITISQNVIEMHDLLQEMGWDVVYSDSPSEPERRSRLWNPEDIYDVLMENSGTKRLKGIQLDMSRIPELELKPEAFVKMRKLKFLEFHSHRSFQKKSKVSLPQGLLLLPDELRYLRWDGYPSKTLPTKFCSRYLVELHMSFSHVKQLWEGKQDLVNLKVIDLTHSTNLIKIPDLSRAKNLENLNLAYCTNLLELPSSVQYLEKLTQLNLGWCKNLRSLPSLCKVRSLTTLFLRYCPNLIKCPEISSNVRYLYLDATAIEEVPSSIESLRQLEYLFVEDCAKLRNFPTAICHDTVSLRGSPNISTFPVLLGSIRQLYFDGTAIEEVPSSIASLSELAVLSLSNCRRLRSISTSIHKLKSLCTLDLQGCSRFEIFPEILETMVFLRNLDLSGTALKGLPSSIENLIGLCNLRLNNCENLACLPESFSKLKSRKDLHLNGCTNLVPLPELPASAMYLNAHDCTSLEEVTRPNISTLLVLSGNIRQLYSGETAVQEVPSSIASLSELAVLSLANCRRLRRISTSIHKLKSLEIFVLVGCSRLEIFPEIFETMERLEKLDLSGTALKELPSSIENLIGLRELRLNNCENLACLPDSFSKLKSLWCLYLNGCTNLVTLPELPASVMYLNAHDCTSLEEVTSPKNLFDQKNIGETWVGKVWLFSNCFLLDRQAVGNLGIPKSQMLFGHMVILLKEYHHHHHHHQGPFPKTEFITCIPGGEIPECFYYKSVGSSITIQLPSDWCNGRESISGFIASFVVSFQDCSEPHEEFGIRSELRLKSCDGADCHDFSWNSPLWMLHIGMDAPPLIGSTHLALLYKTIQASDNCIYTEASFKFYPVCGRDWLQCAYCEVKLCGVHLLPGKTRADHLKEQT